MAGKTSSIIISIIIFISSNLILYKFTKPFDEALAWIVFLFGGLFASVFFFIINPIIVYNSTKNDGALEIVPGEQNKQYVKDKGCLSFISNKLGCGSSFLKYSLAPFYYLGDKDRYTFGGVSGTLSSVAYCGIAIIYLFATYKLYSHSKNKKNDLKMVGLWNAYECHQGTECYLYRLPVIITLCVFAWIFPISKLSCLLTDEGKIPPHDSLTLPVIGAWPLYDAPEPSNAPDAWKGGCKHSETNWLLFILTCFIYIDIFLLLVSPVNIKPGDYKVASK
jgi:hypothetical protein